MGKMGVSGRHGVTTQVGIQCEIVSRQVERVLDSLRKPRGDSCCDGAKGQGSPTFDPHPPFSKHPSPAGLLAAVEQ